MSITDRARRDLYTELEQQLGAAHASTLMEMLPHQRANELVTTSHLNQVSDGLRADYRVEMADLRAELKTEMADLRTELKTEMADLRTDFGDRFSQTEAKMTRWFVTSTAANLVAVVTALTV